MPGRGRRSGRRQPGVLRAHLGGQDARGGAAPRQARPRGRQEGPRHSALRLARQGEDVRTSGTFKASTKYPPYYSIGFRNV